MLSDCSWWDRDGFFAVDVVAVVVLVMAAVVTRCRFGLYGVADGTDALTGCWFYRKKEKRKDLMLRILNIVNCDAVEALHLVG